MEPQPNPLQELQIKEKERNKADLKITEKSVTKETDKQVKQKIKTICKDIQQKKMESETPEIEPMAPVISKIKKQETEKDTLIKQAKKTQIQSIENSPTKALKPRHIDSNIKKQNIEEQTETADDNNQKWVDERKICKTIKTLDLQDLGQKSKKISSELEQIKYEESYYDDAEVIRNTRIKIEKNDDNEEIQNKEINFEKNKTKKEKNKTNQEQATKSKSKKKLDSEQNSDIAKQSEIVKNESKIKGLFEASATFETTDPPDRKRRNFYPRPNKHGLSAGLLIILITMATSAQIGTSHKKYQ